jgi:hypothetical protein
VLLLRAAAGAGLHGGVMLAVAAYLERQQAQAQTAEAVVQRKSQQQGGSGNSVSAHTSTDEVMAPWHRRWKALGIAASCGVVAAAVTYPADVIATQLIGRCQVMGAECAGDVRAFNVADAVRALRRHAATHHVRGGFVRNLFRGAPWAVLTAAPYVGAAQWLYYFESALPAAATPASAPSALFPPERRTSSYRWLDWANVKQQLEVAGLGLAFAAHVCIGYPIETWRRRAMYECCSVGSIVVRDVRSVGVVRTIARSYRGFGVGALRMMPTMATSYVLFAALMDRYVGSARV